MANKPFSPEELEIIGHYPKTCPQGYLIDKFNTPISAKENYMRLLRKEVPYWMPNGEVITFCPSIIPDNIARYAVAEAEEYPIKGGKDMFGIEWVYVEVADGCMVKPGNPLLQDANEWREKVVFPDVSKWDWEGCAQRNKEYLADRGAPLFMTHYNGYFERLISFMDFEGAAMAMIDEDQKDAVKDLFAELTKLYIQIIDLEKKYFDMTAILFHDDWGSQRAPFFSIDTHREMILPYIQQITSHCHEIGVLVELHSCGCNELLGDSIAESGIDMWRPQPMNNIDRMYKLYGDKFLLGVRQPIFKPDATDEEKIEAAKALLARYNEPGKYVYTMSHFQDPLFRKTLYEESRRLYAAL
ncbi:MAG: methyltransferase [Oscillospiraceae bacterium]|nr:methyltransferase [Oscillospiraceae bacterium]